MCDVCIKENFATLCIKHYIALSLRSLILFNKGTIHSNSLLTMKNVHKSCLSGCLSVLMMTDFEIPNKTSTEFGVKQKTQSDWKTSPTKSSLKMKQDERMLNEWKRSSRRSERRHGVEYRIHRVDSKDNLLA